MRKLIISLAGAMLLIASLGGQARAQCKEQVVYQCSALPGTGTFLREFNTKLKHEDNSWDTGQRYAQHLNMNTRYRFTLCAQEGFQDKVMLTLYDSKHPESTNPYDCTFDVELNADKKYFEFVCTKTGIYYISIRYKPGSDSKKGCAVGVLSFKGKASPKDLGTARI